MLAMPNWPMLSSSPPAVVVGWIAVDEWYLCFGVVDVLCFNLRSSSIIGDANNVQL